MKSSRQLWQSTLGLFAPALREATVDERRKLPFQPVMDQIIQQ
jgi:hypothetical protein